MESNRGERRLERRENEENETRLAVNTGGRIRVARSMAVSIFAYDCRVIAPVIGMAHKTR